MLKKLVLAGVVCLGACAPMKTNTLTMTTRYVATFNAIPRGEAASILGEDHVTDFHRLVRVATNHGIKVVVEDLWELENKPLWGAYLKEKHILFIDKALTGNGKFATIAHELGHAFATDDMPEPENDIVAEAISYIVCLRRGLDIGWSSFGYLHGNQEFVVAMLHKHEKLIDRTAELLLHEMVQ